MKYRVVLQRLALQDLDDAYAWAASRAPDAARRWLDRFHESLRSLEMNPERCPVARENSQVNIELREFLFGKKTGVFRAVYTIDNDTVRILRIRRAQRRFLTSRQIRNALDAES